MATPNLDQLEELLSNLFGAEVAQRVAVELIAKRGYLIGQVDGEEVDLNGYVYPTTPLTLPAGETVDRTRSILVPLAAGGYFTVRLDDDIVTGSTSITNTNSGSLPGEYLLDGGDIYLLPESLAGERVYVDHRIDSLDNAKANKASAIASIDLGETAGTLNITYGNGTTEEVTLPGGSGTSFAREFWAYQSPSALDRSTVDEVAGSGYRPPQEDYLQNRDREFIIVQPEAPIVTASVDVSDTVILIDGRVETAVNGVLTGDITIPSDDQIVLIYTSDTTIDNSGTGITPIETTWGDLTSEGVGIGSYTVVGESSGLYVRVALRHPLTISGDDLAGATSLLSTEVFAEGADTIAPADPTNVSVTPGDSKLVIGWQAPGDADLDGFNIYSRPAGGGTETFLTAKAAGDTTHEVTGLTNGTALGLGVSAFDTSENESGIVWAPDTAPVVAYADAKAVFSLSGIPGYTGPVVRGYRVADTVEQDFTAAEVMDGTLAAFANGGEVMIARLYNLLDPNNGSDMIPQTNVATDYALTTTTGGVKVDNGSPYWRANSSNTKNLVTENTYDPENAGSAMSVVYRISATGSQPLLGNNDPWMLMAAPSDGSFRIYRGSATGPRGVSSGDIGLAGGIHTIGGIVQSLHGRDITLWADGQYVTRGYPTDYQANAGVLNAHKNVDVTFVFEIVLWDMSSPNIQAVQEAHIAKYGITPIVLP